MTQTIKISIYSTSQCPNCKRAKTFFQKRKIRFVEFNIEKNRRAFKDFQKFNARGVPIITIGKNIIHGFLPKKIEQILLKQGLG